ncbi:MAG: hypothetical protein H7Z14_10105 [Anaerolineae bacterium]|nr:hypothetical protein [Phycisphaerae bacterium]
MDDDVGGAMLTVLSAPPLLVLASCVSVTLDDDGTYVMAPSAMLGSTVAAQAARS